MGRGLNHRCQDRFTERKTALVKSNLTRARAEGLGGRQGRQEGRREMTMCR